MLGSIGEWSPERPVLGSVRYMSSADTALEFDLKPYLAHVERLPTIAAVGRRPLAGERG